MAESTLFLTSEQVAEALSVTPQTVRNWIRKDVLAGEKYGHVFRIRNEDFAAFAGIQAGSASRAAHADARAPETGLAPGQRTSGAARDNRAPKAPVLALTVGQACASLSVSLDIWHEHIEPNVKIVHIGRRKLIPVRELERWLDEHAEAAEQSAA